jgi:Flp pilus assembly pilin Flp
MLDFFRLNLKAFISDEEGVSALEYAIIAVLILGAVVVAIQGADIKELFNNMSNVLSKANAIKPLS